MESRFTRTLNSGVRAFVTGHLSSRNVSEAQTDSLANSRKVGWSQWVDATLRSNPTCIENKG
jgi:hypothetical protein